MKITALLNPAQETLRRRSQTSRSTPFTSEPESTSVQAVTPRKIKTKLAKDAPRFEKGPVKGEVNYAPYIITDNNILKRLGRHAIYPTLKEIYDKPQTIPYSSDKKEFSTKTARGGFEVFHYEFKLIGAKDSDKPWLVMWDYNVGLVRITPFFKCMPGSKKTDPKNAILASPGLLDLCYSITGGSIVAQGYWVPYEAARALAKTFCYDIRYALTPLFGPSFANQCTLPDDPVFRRWQIPAIIVSECIQQSSSWSKFTLSTATTGPSRPPNSRESTSKRTPRAVSKLKIVYKGEVLRPRDRDVYDLEDLAEDDKYMGDGVSDSQYLAIDDADSSSTTSYEDDDKAGDADFTPPTTATDGPNSRATSFEPGWNAVNRQLPIPKATTTSKFTPTAPLAGRGRRGASPALFNPVGRGKKRMRGSVESGEEADRDSSGEERKRKQRKAESEERDAAARALVSLMDGSM